jgi:serine/threonine-protein kinase
MSEAPPPGFEALPLALARRVDEICLRFEAAWRAGGRPRIEDYLVSAAEPEYPCLLRELVRLDAHYRQSGEPPIREDLLRITLTVTAGPHAGQVFRFTGHDCFLVGRSARAHFRLQPGEARDRHVSRLHFLVEVNPPLCRLHDMGSRNGTRVNGRRVTAADLHHGDEIRAGHTTLKVALEEIPGEPTSPWWGGGPPPALPPEAVVPRPALLSATSCVACAGPLGAGERTACAPCRRQAVGRPQPIPGYLLLRELGKGGMGVVHLAVTAEDTPVAVKTILPAGAARPGQVERFLREANILRSLDHPHIVAFRDMGAAGRLLFFAMDYVPGTDAARLLREKGQLAVRTAVRIVNQLLQALESAHGLGFVHRDVKPANLLLQTEGRRTLKVADFGLARVYQASQLSGLTLPNEMGGTLAFMPPEQITHYREVRPAADQYSAAATLYNLLTGRHVHDLSGPVARQLDRILQEDAVPIRSRRADLPADLAAVLHRALARDPADRYPDVAHFRRALLPFAR